MKRAPRSRQRHDLYAKYHDYDSEISDLLGECGIKGLPDAVRIGFHICCGTMPAYPVQKLDDVGLPVELANAIQVASAGRIDYFHLPAMVESDEAYFAPLAHLDVGKAEIYLGLECNDGLEGMERRIKAAHASCGAFGVAHYCGYFWNKAVMPELLQTLAEGSDRNRLLHQHDAETR